MLTLFMIIPSSSSSSSSYSSSCSFFFCCCCCCCRRSCYLSYLAIDPLKDAPFHQKCLKMHPFTSHLSTFLPQLSLDTCGFGFLNVFHTPIGPDIFGHIHWLAIRASLELCGDSVVVAVCRAEQQGLAWFLLWEYCGMSHSISGYAK